MTNEDYAVLSAMQSSGGSFVRALSMLGFLADDDNLAILKAAWPELWRKYGEISKLPALSMR